ncbi:hypothetical protein AU377_09415 [Sporosarcina sp. HYO08]|nr:hypothetical protein AU377_09415 [Sporosarcina sp. HYO08]
MVKPTFKINRILLLPFYSLRAGQTKEMMKYCDKDAGFIVVSNQLRLVSDKSALIFNQLV